MKWIIRESERIGSAHWLAWTVAVLLAPSSAAELALAEAPSAGPQADANAPLPGMSAVQHDWLRQAEALDAWRRGVQHGAPAKTQADAAGAVDGVKDGKYAFHTGQEPNPWWQVDLGQSTPLARLVVYNRLDYAPGLHNADTLLVLTSNDGQAWTRRYDNQGTHFGGISGAKPLEVAFGLGELKARFVRLQIPSPQPIFLHLDEVEVYGEADPARNLALHKPADQSSLSIWSTSKLTAPPNSGPVPLPTGEILRRGRLLAADLRQAGLDTAPLEREFGGGRGADGGAIVGGNRRRAALPVLRRPPSRPPLGLRESVAAVRSTAVRQAVHAADLSRHLFEPHALGVPARRRPVRAGQSVFRRTWQDGGSQHLGRPTRAGPCPRDGPVVGRRPDRVRLRSHEVVRSADSTMAPCVLRVPQQRP